MTHFYRYSTIVVWGLLVGGFMEMPYVQQSIEDCTKGVDWLQTIGVILCTTIVMAASYWAGQESRENDWK